MWLLLFLLMADVRQLKPDFNECRLELSSCELALERVPPPEFRRIADELAECKQREKRLKAALVHQYSVINH